mgnify:CR=1 FL=1
MRMLTCEDFAPLVGHEFRLGGAADARTLRLRQANLHAPASKDPRARVGGSFALYFEGASEERFQQGMFSVEHASLGVFDIFLVPVGESDGRTTYEAVFN